jgi:lysophospholipase L1-like esterase
MGYGPKVPALLGDGYDVWQPPENGRYCVFTLHCLSYEWRDGLRATDVIHWNNGLWDVKFLADGMQFIPLDVYVRTMLRIADVLQKNAKKVIFATTTPVNPAHTTIFNADIERYNGAVVPVLREKGVLISDLYSLMAADIDRFIRKDDNIHLTEDGAAVCAAAVADAIRRAE